MQCDFGECAFGRQCVMGFGPMPADILLIGEAPGARELREGRPFVGPAGGLLSALLTRAGLKRDELRITNTCGCVDMTREIKRPLPAELDACRPRLHAEIERTNPRAILLMGNTAIAEFFPGFKIGEVYNRARMWNGRVVMPTYHPAHVLRGAHQVEPVILEAIEKMRSFT